MYKSKLYKCRLCSFEGINRNSLQIHIGKMHNKTKQQLLLEIGRKVKVLRELYGIEDRFCNSVLEMYEKSLKP